MAGELPEPEKKALQELKKLIQTALNNHQLPSSLEGKATIWGIPLLGDDKSDDVILKFLRARGSHVMDAFAMIKNAMQWRKEADIESILGEEDLGNDYEKVMVTHGYDKEGYPVWYLVLEQRMSSEVQKQRKFLRWLIQFVEKNVRKLDFGSSRNSFALVIDLKNSTWYEQKVIHKFLQLVHDNYPEFVAKQIWVNASWWYRNYCRVYSIVVDGWSSNREVFSGSTKTVDTLFKYICPGQLPVKYGGLSRDDKQDSFGFTAADPVSEVTIQPGTEHSAQFTFAEACDVAWELRVEGWDVGYEAAFVPSMQGRYFTYISRPRKLTPTHEPVISNSFRIPEPGKLVFTIHNVSSNKKKKLLSRIRVIGSHQDTGDAPSLRGWLVHSNP